MVTVRTVIDTSIRCCWLVVAVYAVSSLDNIARAINALH